MRDRGAGRQPAHLILHFAEEVGAHETAGPISKAEGVGRAGQRGRDEGAASMPSRSALAGGIVALGLCRPVYCCGSTAIQVNSEGDQPGCIRVPLQLCYADTAQAKLLVVNDVRILYADQRYGAGERQHEAFTNRWTKTGLLVRSSTSRGA